MEESPKVFGPGYWIFAHNYSARCNVSRDYELIILFSKIIIDNIPCSKCRNEAIKYMTVNPLKLDRNDPESAFKWWWKFHNTVNRRLGKDIMSYEEALKKYKVRSSEVIKSRNEKLGVLNEKYLTKESNNSKYVCTSCESSDNTNNNLLDLLKTLNVNGKI